MQRRENGARTGNGSVDGSEHVLPAGHIRPGKAVAVLYQTESSRLKCDDGLGVQRLYVCVVALCA